MENDIWNEISSFLNQLRCENINRESYIYFQELANIQLKKKMEKEKVNKLLDHIEYKDFDYVCCQENGEPRSLTAMNQALTKICNRNGLPNITVHGLRHMFATILIELGVPLFKISGLLGHSSVHTTYEYYCEIMDEQDKIIAFVNNTFVPQRTGTEG